jgi:hypothetical protein
MPDYPDVLERIDGAMTAREVQLLHLLMLAVELDILERSTTLMLSNHDVPVLYVPKGSLKLKIKAELRDDQWFYTWGRGPTSRIEVNGRSARRIAVLVTAP